MKDILIIGGNGYIGSALYAYLGVDVCDSIDICRRNAGLSRKKDYNDFDISSYTKIVLLAATSSINQCEKDGLSFYKNVNGFYGLCDRLSYNQTLIYASSAGVYGSNNKLNREEDIEISPINNYSLQKITWDVIANYWINKGKKIIGLRFGTVCGPSPNMRNDLIINSMVKSALENGYIRVSNRHAKRPILCLKDLCRLVSKILTSDLESGQYNTASFNASFGEIANKIVEMLKCQCIEEGNSINAPSMHMDMDKITNSLNFEFQGNIVSVIEDLIELYVSDKKLSMLH